MPAPAEYQITRCPSAEEMARSVIDPDSYVEFGIRKQGSDFVECCQLYSLKRKDGEGGLEQLIFEGTEVVDCPSRAHMRRIKGVWNARLGVGRLWIPRLR